MIYHEKILKNKRGRNYVLQKLVIKQFFYFNFKNGNTFYYSVKIFKNR